MIAIACVDSNNGIGKNGELLISIPDDMKNFREQTKNSIVIMGRKTLFSFKNKAPLPNRINIVFTRNTKLKEDYKDYDNIFFVSNKSDMFDIINKYEDKNVFLIGGAQIYNDFINLCDKAIITKLDKSFEADTFFPNLEENGFTITNESEVYTYDDIHYKFITYEK